VEGQEKTRLSSDFSGWCNRRQPPSIFNNIGIVPTLLLTSGFSVGILPIEMERRVYCATLQEALDLLRHCLEDGEVVIGRHFRDELAAENLTIDDARFVMQSGMIYQPPESDIKTGEDKYRVEGYEPGGKWLAVIFSFKTVDRAFLITIFSVESKGRRK